MSLDKVATPAHERDSHFRPYQDEIRRLNWENHRPKPNS